MGIDISQHFKAVDENTWQTAALKSLKLEEKSQLEQKMNRLSFEEVVHKSYYSKPDQSVGLNSFPTQRYLTRISSYFDESELSEGMDFVICTGEHQHPKVFNIVTNEKIELGKNSLLDIYHLYQNFGKDSDALKSYLGQTSAGKTLIRTGIIHNAGASIVQELSFALSMIKFNQEELENKRPLVIELAIDSMFFNNIAKLRALRFMLESLQEQCAISDFEILAVSSKREQTLYDPWVNMLRGTTNYSAGILGGADIVAVQSYDELGQELSSKASSALGIRQSRNAYHVLQEESHLSMVADPAQGSYVIEGLTNEFIELSFEKFKTLESSGGVLNCLNKFSLEVERVAKARYQAVAKIKYTIAGVNNYPNIEDELSTFYGDEFELKQEKGLFPLRRNSEEFEKLRLSLANQTIKPLVLAYGNEAKISARMMFCANYLELLGHKCEVKFFDPKESYDQFDVIVLCASDDTYAEFVPQLKIKNETPVLIAGKKFEHDGYQNIYMGQDVLAVLSNLFKEKK